MKITKEQVIGGLGVVGIIYYVFFCKKSPIVGGEDESQGGGGGGGFMGNLISMITPTSTPAPTTSGTPPSGATTALKGASTPISASNTQKADKLTQGGAVAGGFDMGMGTTSTGSTVILKSGATDTGSRTMSLPSAPTETLPKSGTVLIPKTGGGASPLSRGNTGGIGAGLPPSTTIPFSGKQKVLTLDNLLN